MAIEGSRQNRPPREEVSKEKVSSSVEIFNQTEKEALLRAVDHFIHEIRKREKYDAMVFLDKSARLVGHLISERWKQEFSGDDVPDLKFVKIGKEMADGIDTEMSPYYTPVHKNLLSRGGVTKNGRFDDNKFPSPETIWERAKGNRKSKRLLRKIKQAFSKSKEFSLEGKRILIVDEFISSAHTLGYAVRLFSAVFPDSKVEGAALFSKWEREGEHEEATPQHLAPDSLVNQFGGLKTPRLPSTEDRDAVFITPQRISTVEESIKELQKNIQSSEERVDGMPEQKRIKWVKRERSAGYEYHPEVKKLESLKRELERAEIDLEKLRQQHRRYRDAREEIHQIARQKRQG
jgi:hypoxanthine phosphoribosyltransferase